MRQELIFNIRHNDYAVANRRILLCNKVSYCKEGANKSYICMMILDHCGL